MSEPITRDRTLVECVVVETGGRVYLPLSIAEQFAAAGRVRMPEPKPDLRYKQPSATPLMATWGKSGFDPRGGQAPLYH